MEKKEKKKWIPIVLVLTAIVFILVISLTEPFLSKDEQLAYENAVALKQMMKDPDSFRLYDEMFLLKCYNEEGELTSTYTVFEYGGANSYGGIVTDEAIFKDEQYLGDWDDRNDEEFSIENFHLSVALSIARINILQNMKNGDTDFYKRVDINIDKIKKKMDLM